MMMGKNHLEFYEIKGNSLTSPSFPMHLPRGDLLNEVCILPDVLLSYRYMSVCVPYKFWGKQPAMHTFCDLFFCSTIVDEPFLQSTFILISFSLIISWYHVVWITNTRRFSQHHFVLFCFKSL